MSQWHHYIGGFYTPQKFIDEAERHGASRRCPPNVARSMAYGDLVHCLAWNGGQVACFATFAVHGVSAQEEIARVVASDLEAEGKCHEVYDRGNVVVRACGSYVATVVHEVTAPLGEVVDRLISTGQALGIAPTILIMGSLGEVYDPPRTLPIGTPFFRGFRKVTGQGVPQGWGSLTGVADYRVRTTVHCDDFGVAIPLPGLMGAER